MCAYTDDEHTRLTIEITLPGLPKENINLRMHEDSFALSSLREDIRQATTLSFCCPVRPEEAKARYDKGLLRIEDVSPHTLRHTFGKNLVDAGVPLDRVATLLGHNSLNTTRIYTVPSRADLQDAVESITTG